MTYTVAAGEYVFCCIECARHNGVEPERIANRTEALQPCDGCGFDPLAHLPVQDMGNEEIEL